MAASLEVSVWRGAAEGRFESYAVPECANQTVLDVVTYIQRRIEPSLAYRFACRVGMCGSCAMTVNGRARWTCRTHVAAVAKGGRLRIAPLRNMTVIKDLAVDMPSARGLRLAPVSPPSARTQRSADWPMRPSNASAAAFVTRLATWSPGTLIIWVRPPSTGPGRCITTNVTGAGLSASGPSPGTLAATHAIATRAAGNAAPSTSIRRPPSPG